MSQKSWIFIYFLGWLIKENNRSEHKARRNQTQKLDWDTWKVGILKIVRSPFFAHFIINGKHFRCGSRSHYEKDKTRIFRVSRRYYRTKHWPVIFVIGSRQRRIYFEVRSDFSQTRHSQFQKHRFPKEVFESFGPILIKHLKRIQHFAGPFTQNGALDNGRKLFSDSKLHRFLFFAV